MPCLLIFFSFFTFANNTHLIVMKEQAKLPSLKTPSTSAVYKKLTRVAKETQQPLKKWLQNYELRSYYLINAIEIRNVGKKDLSRLSQHPLVHKVIPIQTYALQEPLTHKISRSSTEDSLRAIGAIRAQRDFSVTGKGIVIAGQDTGYEVSHPTLQAKYRGHKALPGHDYNWHDAIRTPLRPIKNRCGYDLKSPCDDHGHGTHTMGTMVGSTQSSRIGIAPEAKWIGCRNMDRGVGTITSYLECFEFFLAPYPLDGNPLTDGRPELAPHIINNSWGCPTSEGCDGGEFRAAIKNLQKAGIMVVVSAGNDGPDCGTINSPPATYSEELISVGAYDHRTGEIASFSSRGPSTWAGETGPTLAAPGYRIRSAYLNGGYRSMSGTSMAGPHVAGAIALLWQAKPQLIGQIEETTQLLKATATPKLTSQNCGENTSVPNASFGFGTINIYKAIAK